MFHFVAHARPRTVLFRHWSEGVRLYETLGRIVPNVVALCVMPDHVHLQSTTDDRRSFGDGLASYARWRNNTRATHGPVFVRSPPPSALVGRDKIRRSVRYIHLNPCRARLVDDPLSWPLSTHRDAVGLSIAPIRGPEPDPHAFHAYVSADPHVCVTGTLLPVAPTSTLSLDDLAEAVCSLHRTSREALSRRGRPRALFLHAARALSGAPGREIAAAAGVTRGAVYGASSRVDGATRTVSRVALDPRFASLWPGDLRTLPTWRRWRDHQ